MKLQQSILKTIAYFNIFNFPLTAEEIKVHLYKYGKPVNLEKIQETLDQIVENEIIECVREHYVSKGRAHLIETRKTRKFIAEKFWARTNLYGQYMRLVPFVRMIAVCNNLSYDNPTEQSDIDLFVVIEPGRMWTARLIITLILQFFGVRRHRKKIAGRFCLSFFITSRKLNIGPLQIKPEDPYLAYWTQTLTPIYGEDIYLQFIEANKDWLFSEYKLKFPETAKRHRFVPEKSYLKNIWEYLLKGWFGDFIEYILKKTFKRKTLKSMNQVGVNSNVIVTDDILKFHNYDRRKEYLEKWRNSIC